MEAQEGAWEKMLCSLRISSGCAPQGMVAGSLYFISSFNFFYVLMFFLI